MATRGRTTFQKRQKEMARKEKRQIKAERRAQRKLEKANIDRPAAPTNRFPPGWEPGSESEEKHDAG